MRITNIMPDPLYLSYASSAPGGRKLQPGEASPVLPFKVLLSDQLWRDLRNNRIRIRLDKGDEDFIADILAAHKQEIKVTERPRIVLPPPPPVAPKPTLKLHEQTPALPKSTKSAAHDVSAVPQFTPPTPEALKQGKVSLKDLQNQNLSAIQEHLRSRV